MIVCITGMHRSGTSMIARLLNLCGVYLGPESDLISPADDNPEGFWENKNFLDLNEEILALFGGSWDTVPTLNKGWQRSDQLLELKARACALIDQFKGYENWGWKDPRCSLTLPFWQDLIPELKVVVCLRNPLEVSKSFYRRGYSSNLFSFQLWQSYHQVLNPVLPVEDSIITHYQSYFLDSQSELKRLLLFLGISVDDKIIEDACRTVSVVHKHNQATLDDVISAHPPTGLMKQYVDLCSQAGEVYWRRYYREMQQPSMVELDDMPEASRVGLLLQLNDKDMALEKISNESKRNLQQIEIQEKEIVQKAKEIKQKDGELRRLVSVENELHMLQNSLAVKALYKFRKVTDSVFPHFSKRRKLYDLGVRATGVLLQEGPRGIWSRIQARRYASIQEKPQKTGRAGFGKLPVTKQKNVSVSQSQDKLAKVYADALITANGKMDADYVPITTDRFSADEVLVKLIAFYLPQFHPIPENDEWWGRGFTEWANVAKGVPQFTGHYQPHLPGELGFYDLRLPEVQRRQVELAKQYGIYGFSFYYYWFNGKRLLERPLDQFIADPQIDFPFCLCWANENWTRRWDGQESDILIAQNHSVETDIAFIRDIEPYLRHKNYIKNNGRPVLIVYRPQIMPDPVGTAKRWREYCKENGLGEIYLVAAQTFGLADPHTVGFDAAVEFPPHGIVIPEVTKKVEILNPNYAGKIYNYPHVVDYMMRKTVPDYPLFRTVTASWDNTARRQNHAHIFINAHPSVYQAWLTHDIEYTMQNFPENERFVFINAWNEWAEGTHLEPDKRHGYAYLQNTLNALRSRLTKKGNSAIPSVRIDTTLFREINKEHDTAVILHIYYPELWDEISSYLNNLKGEFDFFISIPENVKFDTKIILQGYPSAHIYRCKNQGRDIAPFIKIFKDIYPLNYQYICKIHTKKTTHRENGEHWRKDLLTKLLGSTETILQAKQLLDSKIDIGLLAPKGHLLPVNMFIAENEENLGLLAKKAGIFYENKPDFDFIAGSMFWFKPLALSTLVYMDFTDEDFGVEKGLKDGTPAHAFERFIGLLALQNHFNIIEIGENTKDSPKYNFAAKTPQVNFRRISHNPIIVYQMGKVGSMSVVRSLEKAFKKLSLNIPVHHRHILNNLDEIEQAIRKERPNPDETLAEIQEGKKLLKFIQGNSSQRWNVISLVRDPVARNVATFFQNLPEIVPDWKQKTKKGTLDVVELQKTFLNMKSIHGAPDHWFDDQLKPVFGVDVYSSPFPKELGYKIYKGPFNADVLVIRLENLNDVAKDAIYDFLGLKDLMIVHTNTTESKEYAHLYQEFKKLPLPTEYLERIYNSKVSRHFYTADELEKFTILWQREKPKHNFATPMPSETSRKVNLESIIVYQVGKVGSRTILKSLQKAYQSLHLNVPVHHVHVLENLDELEKNLKKNFVNPVDNLAYIKKSKELRKQIEKNPDKHWKIISLVREPIARNIGSFFQNIALYMPDWKEQYDNGTLSMDELQEVFLNNESIHIAADWWFDKQLKPLFGIDVFESDFPAEVGYKIYESPASNASLLLIRLEDLNLCAERAMYEFLGLKDFVLYNTNISDEKDYAKLYQAFKQKPLPLEYIEKMYKTRSVSHFYRRDELDAFASRWLNVGKH
jgi:lipopolysaccharide biosynthesis protein